MLNFRKKKKPNPDATQLLAAILVVYPEISTVSYDPKESLIQLSFALKGMPEQKSFDRFAAHLVNSVEAYHQLEGFSYARIRLSIEGEGETFFFQVKRDMETLSRGELNILTTLVEEQFAEGLVFDEANEMMDMDFMMAQEDHLDQMLYTVRQIQIPDRLVGIRERERVVVYTR